MGVQGVGGQGVVVLEHVEPTLPVPTTTPGDLTPPLPPGTPAFGSVETNPPAPYRCLSAFRTLGFAGAAAVFLSACGGPPAGAPLNRPPPQSHRAIAGVPVTLARRGAPDAEKYNHYSNIIAAAGGELRGGRPYVLALRGLDFETGVVAESRATSRMSDTIVVLNMTADGLPVVHEFVGSTHPGQKTTTGIGQDVTGDGIKDVGMVAEGTYRVAPNTNAAGRLVDFNGEPSYRVRTRGGSGSLPAVRDTNQDGIHSPDEWAFARDNGIRASGILFHVGWEDQHVNSVGCFNVRGFQDFIAAVGGVRAHYDVTIVNAYADEPR